MGEVYFFKIIFFVLEGMAEANDLKRGQDQNTKHGNERYEQE